jgi:hypothetical protein
MIKYYLILILGISMFLPVSYIAFKSAGKNPIEYCGMIFIPSYILGILLFNYIENGNCFNFRDKNKE